MNIVKTILILSFLSSLSVAQTRVDGLVKAIDSLATVTFDNWRVSPDLKGGRKVKGDPTKYGYDDSKWDTLRIGQWIYPDSCWLRKEIALPENILGQPVSGSVRFVVTVDDYGYLWVNGDSKGYFPWDGEFELTKNAHPGEKFLIAIKAINTGGPLRLLRASIENESIKPLREMIHDFSLSLRVGQKLLSFDTYQTSSNKKVDPGTDKSTMDKAEKTRLGNLLQDLASRVDIEALRSGQLEKFQHSLADVRSQLKPIGEFAKRFTLYFDANAHIDAAWLWRDKETIEVCKNTFASVLHMMDVSPEFTYTQSSAAYYDWMEQFYPDIFKGIQKRINDGRWEVVGGMWVEPDCNLPSGESWMHHLLYAKKYFQKKLGATVKIGWNPDSFGYNWNMPEFYANAGIDAFITQKIGWNERNVFPYRVFWWESPDASRILTYFPFDYVNTIDDPYRLTDWLRQFEANTGFTKMMMLFGVGDHGGGPSLEMIDRIEHLKTLDVFPAIEYGTAGQYLDWLKKQDLSRIPTWKDELYLEYHQGTYTTQAKTKEFNRKDEILLSNAEKFSTVATTLGGKYNGADLEEAWRKVLFNQFHDVLPGSGIRENYIDATEKYLDATAIGEHELNAACQIIADRVNTSRFKHGTPVVVFNPLSWERNDIVTLGLPEGGGVYAVFDATGKELATQFFQRDRYHREVMFMATNVPSLGYSIYELRKQKATNIPGSLRAAPTTLESKFFKVKVDPDSGWVSSIVDKRNGKEILRGYGNELQLLQDLPAEYDAWNIGLTGVRYPSKLKKIEIVETGPVRTVLRVTRDYLKPGVQKDFPTEDFPSTFFTQDIILYDGIDRIDFKTDVDWWEEKTMVKVAFPVTVADTAATYEIPYGSIQRSTQWRDSWDSAKVEVPTGRWADLSQNDYGVSLLNTSKYGYDIKQSVIRLSLLRSPKWPDPTADRGKHSIEYALYPHAKSWKNASTVHRAYEYNNPLIAVIADKHKGSLAENHSFMKLEPANLVLTTMKKSENSDAWIIQWYDAKGEDTEAVVTLPLIPKNVFTSNFLEENGTPIQFSGNKVNVKTGKNAVTTIKVRF
ncbi:MAG: glycoside hydrolase family 38 C-terminal domain-containing protein [Bacteroidota bacterium]